MSDTLNELSNLLTKVLDENTFTAGALDRMKAALQRAVDLERQLKAAQIASDGYRAARDSHYEQLIGANLKLEGWAKREAELVKRERAVFDLEKNAAVAGAKAEVYDRCFSLVFKNADLKRTLYENKNVPVPGSNGCMPSIMNCSGSLTETVSTE